MNHSLTHKKKGKKKGTAPEGIFTFDYGLSQEMGGQNKKRDGKIESVPLKIPRF